MKKLAIVTILLAAFFIGKSQLINYAEYFFDEDPGFGSATPLILDSITNNLIQNFNIPTSSLEQGYHNVYIRTQNDSGYWSMPYKQNFYIFKTPNPIEKKIQYAEYFIDNDPGFGLATPISLSASFYDTSLHFDINTSILSRGFHIINVRTYDDKGAWGMPFQQKLYIFPLTETKINKIDYAEYFIDTDPGFNLGIPISVPNMSTDTTIYFIINTKNLTQGFHSINIRAHDENEGWSLSYPHYFYFHGIPDSSISKINYAEYYFDSDPGFGMATPISVTPSSIDTMLVFEVNAAGLSRGFHTINIRARNEDNGWSLFYQRYFYFQDLPDTKKNTINYAEYFFDSDPGFGMATPINIITPSLDTGFLFNVNTTDLTQGFHTINIRALDNNGRWSMGYQKYFYFHGFSDTANCKINYAEYFFNDDPGIGLATPINIETPFVDKIFTFDIETSGLTSDFHTIYLRFRDEKGKWSMSFQKIFFYNGLSDTVKYKIDYAEYFFDADPGIGLGIPININTPFNDKIFIMDINTLDLTTGFHDLFIRFRDEKGRWSIPVKNKFCAFNFQKPAKSKIVYTEYFFDTDPGFGKGKRVDIRIISNYISATFELDMNGIEYGDHVLYMRSKNNLGFWGHPYIYSFTYSMTDMNEKEISSWFHLFPNPSKGNFTIEFIDIQKENVIIKIHEINGRTVYSNLVSTLTPLSLNLVAGIYIVNIESGNKRFSQKLIISP